MLFNKKNLILGAIIGDIAETYYKEIPEYMIDKAIELLPKYLLKIVVEFTEKFIEFK